MEVAVVAGTTLGPRPGTLHAATMLAVHLGRRPPDLTVDVADLGGGLLAAGDGMRAAAAAMAVGAADLAVIASPTHESTCSRSSGCSSTGSPSQTA